MRDLYVNNPVNQPRIKTDVFFLDDENECQYTGFLDKAFRYIRDFRLADPVLWRRFVQQFREDADANGAWRGEYWGKMMRGASMVWAYTRDEELYSVLVQTVHDMIDSANEEGRISSYPLHMEFDAWDLWSRKYVMLGMQYFLEVCPDEALKAEMIASMGDGLYAKKMGGGSVNPLTGQFNFSVAEGYIIKNGEIKEAVRGASLIGKGSDILMNIDMVGKNLERGQGMCGASSGSIPTDVGQPLIRVSSITVGGR